MKVTFIAIDRQENSLIGISGHDTCITKAVHAFLFGYLTCSIEGSDIIKATFSIVYRIYQSHFFLSRCAPVGTPHIVSTSLGCISK